MVGFWFITSCSGIDHYLPQQWKVHKQENYSQATHFCLTSCSSRPWTLRDFSRVICSFFACSSFSILFFAILSWSLVKKKTDPFLNTVASWCMFPFCAGLTLSAWLFSLLLRVVWFLRWILQSLHVQFAQRAVQPLQVTSAICHNCKEAEWVRIYAKHIKLGKKKSPEDDHKQSHWFPCTISEVQISSLVFIS